MTMSSLWLDLRDSLRGLRHHRLYALAVVGTLALTLGGTTAVFSIVNGVLLRPLAYREADRLVSVREVLPQVADRYPSLPANARHFDQWRSRAVSFASMAAMDWRATTLTGVGEPAQLVMLRASGTLFDVLPTPMAMGRPLTHEDERFDRPAVVVINDAMWRDRLGRDPGVLGRSLTLGGTPHTVVGVLPAGYQLPRYARDAGSLTSDAEVIVPMRIRLENVGWMGAFNYPVVARLKEDVGFEQARAELNVLQRSIAEIAQQQTGEPADLRALVVPLDESIVGRARLGLLLLLGAVAAVVLIACANLANLSLTRTIARMRETALRAALGASRVRLVRQVVVEQLLLALAGGGLGLMVAREALNLFVRTAPIDLPRVGDVVIDGRVMMFTAAATIAAGVGVALLPAWRVNRPDVQGVLRAGDRGATDLGGQRTRATLLAAQVALSVTLLAATGLFIASFLRLVRVDPGFSPARVVALEIVPIAARYPDAAARSSLYDRILERVRAIAAVRTASWASALPLTGEIWVDSIARLDDTRPTAQKPSANYRFVGPDYFRTMSMAVLRGRGIEERDRAADVPAAVISMRAAEILWPGQDALGRRFSRGDPNQHFEVVGVVADGHPTALDAESPLMVYVPYWFNNEGRSVLLAHTDAEPSGVIGELRAAVGAVDPEIAVAEAGPLQRVVDRALAGRGYQMWLFTAFGFVALAIATIGVYATTAYGVSRRRREMNIRVALGAPAGGVLGLVLRQTAGPVLLGLAAGCAGAWALGTAMASLLFQVRPGDPVVMASVLLIVGAAGLAAAGTAAKRGLRLDPAAALRED
jgi:putative ABC transport system permease protein